MRRMRRMRRMHRMRRMLSEPSDDPSTRRSAQLSARGPQLSALSPPPNLCSRPRAFAPQCTHVALLAPKHVAVVLLCAVARALLRSGANPNLANARGETPLNIALAFKRPLVAVALLDDEVQHRMVTKSGRHIWAHHLLLRLRLQACCWGCPSHPTCTDCRPRLPLTLMQAERPGRLDPNVVDAMGRSPLMHAVRPPAMPPSWGLHSWTRRLVESACTTDACLAADTLCNMCMLLGQSANGARDLVERLLEMGAEVDLMDDAGETALTLAEEVYHPPTPTPLETHHPLRTHHPHATRPPPAAHHGAARPIHRVGRTLSTGARRRGHDDGPRGRGAAAARHARRRRHDRMRHKGGGVLLGTECHGGHPPSWHRVPRRPPKLPFSRCCVGRPSIQAR